MKRLRGKNLDTQLKIELESMIKIGYKLAPISRSTLQRRLNQNSRSTLAIKHRAEMIESARLVQLEEAGLNIHGKKKRNTLKEQNERLKEQITELEKQRDALIEKLAMIVNGAQAKGYNVEEIMMPIIDI
ncbi:hypothetical protein [uncultured Maribacter sp.]|uniref:hypothetical protein n=1 Tax=uncultured Maribacter sp. TaxID=431308 RepID=UPI00261DCF58|nr:hypothetical protein [uncultured Maribacter sp.]